MNYRHEYHAGNFADVFKHLMLITLIKSQLRKEKPFCYLDTHAGRGLYDLSSETAKKTGDAEYGVIRLLQSLISDSKIPEHPVPEVVKTYLQIIENLHYPPFYPGSPLIAQSLLRAKDRLILMELHPEEFKVLKQNLRGDTRVACHHQNGYQGLTAFLPPQERRGIILMDPPFEQENEWDQMLLALKNGLRKFQNGTFAIWYPMKDLRSVRHLLKSIISLKLSSVLNIEFGLFPFDTPLILPACGMIVVNAPWQFEENCHDWLAWLCQRLSIDSAGSFAIKPLMSSF